MRTRLLALAVLLAAALPLAPAHADPVQDVIDLLDAGCDVDLCIPPQPITDQLLCPVLVALTPGIPGVVGIDPDGDVVVDGSRVHDCPPYDDPQDPQPDPVEPVLDLARYVLDLLNTWCDVDLCIPPYPWWEDVLLLLDPIVCPVYATLSPLGPVGDVVVRPDGDIEFRGLKVWDCPPYEWA